MTDPDTSAAGLRVTCGVAPLQIEGPIDGGYIYFRARHGAWQLGVGRTQGEAIDATIDAHEPTAFYGEDEGERMSSGDREAAWRLIAEHLPRLRLPK